MDYVWRTKATTNAKRLALPKLEENVKSYMKKHDDSYELLYTEIIGGRVYIYLKDTLTNSKVNFIISKDIYSHSELRDCVTIYEPATDYSSSYVFAYLDTFTPWSKGLAEVLFQWLLDVKINLLAKYNAQRIIPKIKEEIVAAAWHPKKVLAWLEAGVQLEDM